MWGQTLLAGLAVGRFLDVKTEVETAWWSPSSHVKSARPDTGTGYTCGRSSPRTSIKEMLGCFHNHRTIVRKHVYSFWTLLVQENEMHSLGRSVWKHHPISSQCCDFIIHFQNPYPLKYKGNQLSLYAFQIPLQAFVSCFS